MSEFQAPKGTQDIFYPDILRWQYLEEKIREYFKRFLYREIRTPVFEHSELFLRSIGSQTEVVQKEMYTFRDKSDRELTLRPENTAAVLRAVIENNLLEALTPLKFLYIGPMFRYDKPQKGRFRQFHQFGVEVLGEEAPQIDAEVIFSAMDFLRSLPLHQVTLHLNSVGCRLCRPAYLNLLQQAAQRQIEMLCGDCRQRALQNPLRIFDCKNTTCIAVSDSFPKIVEHLCSACRDHFARVQHTLDLLDTPYVLNSRLVRGLDYYTQTAFEITSGQLGAQNALLGGGRYDNLLKELGGSDLPGIGFAAGMERIISHLDGIRPQSEKILFIAYQEADLLEPALRLARSLWQQGYSASLEYQFKNLKKQFKRADRLGATYTLILGEEEMHRGCVSIKNMKTQEQVSIAGGDVDEWLKKNL